MGKKMSERRKAIIEEIKERDARRRGLKAAAVKPGGSTVFKDKRRAEAEAKKRKSKEQVCCLVKHHGNLPMNFRPCINCPRRYEMTEAGPILLGEE